MTCSVKIRLVVLCVSVLALAGCATGKGSFSWWEESQRVTGPDPLIKPDSFEEIDLAALLDPTNASARNAQNGTGNGKKTNGTTGAGEDKGGGKGAYKDDEMGGNDGAVLAKERKRLEAAFEQFYTRTNNTVRDRNRIQERIIAASNQRCGQYKNFLKQFDAAANLTLGGLTTAAAGAGAIFTNTDVVRALSGVASILSGVRAELNEAYFQNLTIQVITEGFESRRREFYEEIVNKRKISVSLTDYPVEKAVGDAITYHQYCSLIAGLEHAAISIKRAENPGLKAMTRTFKQMTSMRAWAEVAAGNMTIDQARKVEAGVGGDEFTDVNALDRYNQANIVFDNLKSAKAELEKPEAEIKGIVDFDILGTADKAMLKPLKDAIDEYNQNTDGDAVLKKVTGLFDTETKDKELDQKKTEVEAWVKEWTDITSKARLGIAVKQTTLAQLRAQAYALAGYYDDLIGKWQPAVEESNAFIAQMKLFADAIAQNDQKPVTGALTKPEPATGDEPESKKKTEQEAAPDAQKVEKVTKTKATPPPTKETAEKGTVSAKCQRAGVGEWLKDMQTKGGYVLLFRHAMAEYVKRTKPHPVGGDEPGTHVPDRLKGKTLLAGYDFCNEAREGRNNLTKTATDRATAVGERLKALSVAVGQAYVSPRCRTYDSGQFIINALGVKGLSLSKHDDLKLDPHLTEAKHGERLSAFLADPKNIGVLAEKKNAIVVSHMENIGGYLHSMNVTNGAVYELEATILKQSKADDGKITYQCVGRVLHDQWPEIKK